MESKRPISDDPSTTRASLMNVATGQMIPIKDDTEFIIGSSCNSTFIIEGLYISRQQCAIKYENNCFFIKNLRRRPGNFLNCEHLSRDFNHRTKLQHGDLIGFGDTNNEIVISFKFILHSITNKKPRLDKEHDAEHTEEKNENISIDVLIKMMGDTAQINIQNSIQNKDAAALQKNKNIIMDAINKRTIELNNNIRKLTDYTKRLTAMVLTFVGYSKYESLKLIQQFYSHLETEFKCPICTELLNKATNLNCMHTFCEHCIGTWRQENNVCPVCRSPIQNYNRFLALDIYISKSCDLIAGLFLKPR